MAQCRIYLRVFLVPSRYIFVAQTLIYLDQNSFIAISRPCIFVKNQSGIKRFDRRTLGPDTTRRIQVKHISVRLTPGCPIGMTLDPSSLLPDQNEKMREQHIAFPIKLWLYDDQQDPDLSGHRSPTNNDDWFTPIGPTCLRCADTVNSLINRAILYIS